MEKMPHKAKLFDSAGDWITLVICALMIAGGILGLVMGDAFGAKLASGLAIAGTISFVLMYIFKYKLPKYKKMLEARSTKHGMIVHLSPGMTGLPIAKVEEWTILCMQHWKKSMGWSLEEQAKAIRGVQFVTLDLPYMQAHDASGEPKKFRGSQQGKLLRVVTIPKKDEDITPLRLVKSLFRHELSHYIVEQFGGPEHNGIDAEKLQHDLFKKTKLGA